MTGECPGSSCLWHGSEKRSFLVALKNSAASNPGCISGRVYTGPNDSITASNLRIGYDSTCLITMVAGWIQRDQQQVITYLLAENRVLKAQLGGRLHLTDTDRRRLAALAHPLGRKRLQEVATIATPDTLLRWDKRLIAQKFDGSPRRRHSCGWWSNVSLPAVFQAASRWRQRRAPQSQRNRRRRQSRSSRRRRRNAGLVRMSYRRCPRCSSRRPPGGLMLPPNGLGQFLGAKKGAMPM